MLIATTLWLLVLILAKEVIILKIVFIVKKKFLGDFKVMREQFTVKCQKAYQTLLKLFKCKFPNCSEKIPGSKINQTLEYCDKHTYKETVKKFK